MIFNVRVFLKWLYNFTHLIDFGSKSQINFTGEKKTELSKQQPSIGQISEFLEFFFWKILRFRKVIFLDVVVVFVKKMPEKSVLQGCGLISVFSSLSCQQISFFFL